jgi:hypothetical protein
MNKYKCGRLPKREDKRNLNCAKYVSGLAPAPAAFDNLAIVYSKLGINDPTVLYPMDGNDELGDCTIAGLAHAQTTYNGVNAIKKIPTKEEVVSFYKKRTGGQDTGLAELDVLNYVIKHKFDGEKMAAYVEVDPTNMEHVKLAISLFGGVYIGMNVQVSAETDFEKGITWTAGKLTNDGHCVFIPSYDENGVTVLTWGNKIAADNSWWKCCVNECYAILSKEFLANNPQLQADLAEVTK